MKRVLPAPVLSGALFVLWLLLRQSVSADTLLLGVAVAVGFPLLTASLRPAPVKMRRPLTIARLLVRVGLDMARSNLAVMRLILTRKPDDVPSAFVHVPLELRDPNGLAVLAMIVGATPGTAWAELSFDRSVLLIHVLEVHDPAAVVAAIKQRYERPLQEIFE
jgi:multicomponent K+:H+ antiporter subunit E